MISRDQAMVTGLSVAAAATAVACVLSFKRRGENLTSAAAAAGSSATSSQANERRARSRFRRHQGAGATVVGCASKSEFLACIDHCLNEDDSVVMIRGTTDGTPNKEAGGDRLGESRAVHVVGSDRVRVFEGDIWDVQALLALATQMTGSVITAVCMETSNLFGNDMLCDTLAVIRMLRSVLAPNLKTILVRSRAMALHGRCFHDSRVVLAMSPLRTQQLEISSRTHCQVLAAIGVKDYRDTTIGFVVRRGSSVLEIGCCVGTTTFLLADAAGKEGSAIGIDCGKRCIQRARSQQERQQRQLEETGGHSDSAPVRFEVVDGWDMSALLGLASSARAPFDVIYIDVGGLSVRHVAAFTQPRSTTQFVRINDCERGGVLSMSRNES